MTSFFIDLWHDLRERRLWPVAVGLLAAIVAVPAILFKPVDESTPPSAAVTKPSGAPTLPVVSVESGPIKGSKLEAFSSSEKNPFKPMKDLAAAPGTSGATGSGGSSTGGSGSSGGSGSAGGSGSGSVASGTAGGGGGAVSGGSPGGTSTPATTPHTTRTIEWFRYAADFSFGRTGAKAKTFESVANFTLLPNETTPAVVFLGVDAANKTAMFYIADPGFTADGEGACNADGADCRYVTLKPGESSDEETFSAVDGSVSYDLKLLKINRESLGSGDAPVAPASDTPKNGKTLAATGAGVSAATQTTQDVLPAAFAAGPGVALEQK
jgi:hypothetical protein